MNKELLLLLRRSPYTAQTTSGKLYLCYDGNENYFSFSLEDTLRPPGIKVYGNTGIPEGEYGISLYESPKFGKTLIIYNQDDDKTMIKAGLLKWQYVLFHGGNDHTSTSGCVCIARNRISNDVIQGSMKDELRIFVERKIKEGYSVRLKIVNLPQMS
jgi:hypothetical protein